MIKNITRTHFGVYGFIEKDGFVLVIQKGRGPYTSLYDLPGGSPEAGETPVETLCREINEETGCALTAHANQRSVEAYYDNYTETDGRKGCLHHRGVLFDCVVSGEADSTIDELDSKGALWVEKTALTALNATPFLLMCLKK